MNAIPQVTLLVSLATARKLWPKFRVRAWGDVTNHALRVTGLPAHVEQRITDGAWELILLDCPSANGTLTGDTRRRVIRARDGKLYTRCVSQWPKNTTGEPC